MVFDRAGICRHIPEQTIIPLGARVRAFPLVEKYEWAWIWMGKPELANPAGIPDCPWFDKSGWKARTGRLEVKANHRLIIENLLNMAHLPYVHPRTIGSEGVFNAKVSVKREGHCVRLLREMHNIEPPPTYKKAGGFEGNVNRWQDIVFKAPNLFEFNTGVIDAVHPIPESGTHVSPRPGLRVLSRHTMHAVCPQTDRSTHYYFGFSYNPEEMAEEVAEFVFESAYSTFVEDVEILEAQQINIETTPDRPTIDIGSDAAGNQAMRILDKLEGQADASAARVARTG
jgi:vanillate O-demethylase monooxygenase subunit